ncbi:hypothetical protein D3C84_927170 [compost metagenome]
MKADHPDRYVVDSCAAPTPNPSMHNSADHAPSERWRVVTEGKKSIRSGADRGGLTPSIEEGVSQFLMEWEDVVHPGSHAQQDFSHHGDMVKVLTVNRRLPIGATGHLVAVLGVVRVGDFNSDRYPACRR